MNSVRDVQNIFFVFFLNKIRILKYDLLFNKIKLGMSINVSYKIFIKNWFHLLLKKINVLLTRVENQLHL